MGAPHLLSYGPAPDPCRSYWGLYWYPPSVLSIFYPPPIKGDNALKFFGQKIPKS